MTLLSLLPLSQESLPVYGTLHSLRNFLSVVLGHSQLLASGESHTPQEDLAVIVQSARDAQQMVYRLMHGTDDLSCHQSDVDIGRSVCELARGVQSMALERDITMHVRVPVALFVRIDFIQFREIVLNLMHNGIQSMPQGGTLSVWAVWTEQDVQLHVADTGMGMHPAQVHALFTGVRKSHWGGQGIGLLISQIYAQSAGGSLQAQSMVGFGTTVTLTLPRAKMAKATADRETAEFPADTHPHPAENNGRC